MLISAAGDDWRRVLLGQKYREVEIEPNVKLECVPKFCCVTHLGQDDVWTRQLELGCDVLGLSKRSYRPSWQPVVHHITWRKRFLGSVSRVCRHMGLRHGLWICIAWGEQSVWWWDECVVSLWKIQGAWCGFVQSFRCSDRSWLRWWGMVDWDGLGMWNVRVEMIGVGM